MRKLISAILLLVATTGTYAQTEKTSDVEPKEAFLNVSYDFKGAKMFVNIDKSEHAFIEKTSSTIKADTYTIYTADGKTLLATYTVDRQESIVKMVLKKEGSVKTFDLTEYLSHCSSDLEKDAVKRKVPVYWLYKNGLNKG
jgi:hypothetical protein